MPSNMVRPLPRTTALARIWYSSLVYQTCLGQLDYDRTAAQHGQVWASAKLQVLHLIDQIVLHQPGIVPVGIEND